MNDAFDIKSVTGLTQDSRQVQAGYLFAALPGVHVNGAAYVDEAVRKGAVAILAPEDFSADQAGVPVIHDENPRRRFARMAAEFYGTQPAHIVAVTGTNGKTSTVHFARQIWARLGLKSASLGTLGLQGIDLSGIKGLESMTTPDPVVMHKVLAHIADHGVTHLAMEASSHGLSQYRLDGVRISAAGFTNITQDHLDYHGTMESYLQSKMRLFSEVMDADGTVVLNADIEAFDVLHRLAKQRGIKILNYGRFGRDFRIVKAVPVAEGQAVTLEVLGKSYEFMLPLAGDFQLMNVLCALGLVISQGDVSTEDAIAALAHLEGVPGRLQPVRGHKLGSIYIDYAHTPDALKTVLEALRPHAQGKLVCVFGCGGDRDKTKRPLMGKIAAALADRVIVTDDNPRSEKPAAIRSEILKAAPHAEEIGDRAQAIRSAVHDLQKGDVLVIAGKGHEQGQVFKDRIEPFDDFKQTTSTLEELYS